jgi:biotin carboxyl carrier protein
MPGKIVGVKVAVGQTVKEGDLVAVLEAMKMENEIFAPQGGTIASVNVTTGAMIETNDVIVTIN